MLFGASRFLIQGEVSKIETDRVKTNTARAVDALNNRVDDLAVKNADWANWDDTYNYIVNHNHEYVVSNLSNGSLANLDINFMLFYDRSHTLVNAKGLDSSAKDLAVPRQLYDYFGKNSTLFCDTTGAIHEGFLDVNGQPLFFVARPILTSDATGPSRGTIIFAEYLSSDETEKLASLTHLNLSYFSSSNLPPDAKAVTTLSTTSASVRVLSQNAIDGYQQIDDVFGKPLLVARVQLTRDEFNEASRSLLYFLLIIAFVTLLSILLTLYIADQVVARDQTIQLKNEFFSIASHELRTPLAAIKGNSALLAQVYGPKNDKDFQEITHDIHEASVRLIRLVNNFLDAARLERGTIPLKLEGVNLSEAINQVVDEMQGVATDKHIYIRSNIPGDLPPVKADMDRVKQVIYNLVGNAAKFTETGGITITARVEGPTVKVLVTDTGRGISPEGQKLLFRKFQQTQQSDADKGSGLGLYISKMLIGLMGGTITLESSEVGKGTTLSFSAPILTPQSQQDQLPKR